MIESIRLRGLTLLLASFAALAMGASIEPGFDPWNDAAIYQIEYEVDLSVLADASEWRVWVPLPADNAVQRVVESQLETPGVHRVTEDARGNRYLYLEGSGRPSSIKTSSTGW